jgi:biotin-dependent carboxylase-like uncharacterized protein
MTGFLNLRHQGLSGSSVSVEVVAPGLFTTVQDVRGRPGYQRYGVPVGGALDPFAAATANALVGNAPDAALLEITLVGPTLRFAAPTAFALAGADLSATLDAQPIAPGWSRLARSGSTLSVGERRSGARAYLAFGGGLDLPAVLGSRSTDVRAGLPGLAGRPLRAGDLLPLPGVADVLSRCGHSLPADRREPSPVVRLLPGPHVDRFEARTLDEFCAADWEIGEQADRMGYRLVGPRLRHTRGADVASLGLPVGAVQVPGDGRPIVLLADHQPTGGYTVLACVIRADLGLLAQRTPGDHLRFAVVTLEEARAAVLAQRAELSAIVSDNEVAWASLRWAESGSLAIRRAARRAGR